jgi:hypothetical protein
VTFIGAKDQIENRLREEYGEVEGGREVSALLTYVEVC